MAKAPELERAVQEVIEHLEDLGVENPAVIIERRGRDAFGAGAARIIDDVEFEFHKYSHEVGGTSSPEQAVQDLWRLLKQDKPPRKPPRKPRRNPDIDEDIDQFEDDVLTVKDEKAMGESEEYSLLPFVRQKAGALMLHWHSSMGDPIYAAGSFYIDGEKHPSTETVNDAKEGLSNILEFHADEHEDEDLRELEALVDFLEWDLEENYFGVNG
jgi:hypothetical protein